MPYPPGGVCATGISSARHRGSLDTGATLPLVRSPIRLSRVRDDRGCLGGFALARGGHRRPRVLGPTRRGARRVFRATAPRRPDLAPPAARGRPRHARRGPSLLGDRPLRGHPPHLPRPAELLLGPRHPVRRRPARDPRGIAVVPGHGRPAPHQVAGSRVGRLHAAPGGADRGRHPGQRASASSRRLRRPVAATSSS